MPEPEFIYQNSTYFENLMEHRFLHDIGVELVLRDPPVMINILKAEVDRFGFDLVLSVDSVTRHLQMKTRSGNQTQNPYEISEALWEIPGATVIWMCYDQQTLEPNGYWCLGSPIPDKEQFKEGKRPGFRHVRMRDCPSQNLTISELADLLFPDQEELV